MLKKIKKNKQNLGLITLGVCTFGIAIFMLQDLYLILTVIGVSVAFAVKS